MFDYRSIEATRLDIMREPETTKPRSFLKSVSAFANSSGGHIVFGVTDDNRQAIGVEDAQYTAGKIAELIGTRISPTS
ncbi:MAG: ATP-binding protein [Clostridia bacterium]|nr:ATP-binding protein [Clostridia bacterium]